MSRFHQIKNRVLGVVGDLHPIKYASNSMLFSGATIFMFHRVLPRGTECFEPELRTSQDVFSDFLDWVERSYRVVSLNEIAERQGKSSDRNTPRCAITFDDGWLDNFEYAFPLLQRRGLTATIFLPTRYIGTDRKFWHERIWHYTERLKAQKNGRALIDEAASPLPWFPRTDGDLTSYKFLKKLLLARPSAEAEEFTDRLAKVAGLCEAFPGRAFVDWDEVKQMQAAGIEFGSHTLNHVLLSAAAPGSAKEEVEQSRKELKARIGEEVVGFAYPWGAPGPNTSDQLREAGYRYAVTTKAGWVEGGADRFLLPRVAVSDAVLEGGRTAFAAGKARLSFAKNILTGAMQQQLSAKVKSKKRIKILFVLDLITEWEGGTERQLLLLIRSLDRRYFEPKLCFLFEAPGLAEDSLPCPVRVVCPQSDRVPSVAGRLLRLIRVLREEKPDIVQCFFIEGLILGILAGRIARVPHVVGSARNAGYWRKSSHRLMMKLVTPLAHRWQTNSRFLWQFQKKNEAVPENLIEILPNGMELSRLDPATPGERQRVRKELGLNVEGPICVSVANLAEVKDLPTLIHAAKFLKDKLPSIQFVLVGDGTMRGLLEELAVRLGVADHVRFVGRQADIRPFLVAADFGVLSSRSEGSSNSVLEYMAMGLPVVVSDIPPNRELLSGEFFRPGDAEDFAAKICALWKDPALQSLSRKRNRENLEEFSLENMTMRAESFYVRLVMAGQQR